MESYNKYSGITETQLLHDLNECKKWHDVIKEEIIDISEQVKGLKKAANEKTEQLNKIEKKYVDLMRELTSRQFQNNAIR